MKIKPDKLKNVNKFYREVGPYLGLGMQLAITVTVMVFLGIWLDEKFDLSPVLTIVFASIGVSAGLYNFIKSVIKSGK
ncbi:MAG: AtpZ/AtpI family protein [Bacteroidetes bacterium]|nr:AtpZ/AtpI family protein [Bacteroidota bacterium]